VGESKIKKMIGSIIHKRDVCHKMPLDGISQHYGLLEYDAMVFGR
jgi:hypothetical protein